MTQFLTGRMKYRASGLMGLLFAAVATAGLFAPTSANGQTVYYEGPIHSFSVSSTDGARPFAGLIVDGSGNLYGTTAGGGSKEKALSLRWSISRASTARKPACSLIVMAIFTAQPGPAAAVNQAEAWETTTSASPTITIQVCNPSGARYKGGASGNIRIDVLKH